LQVVDLSREFRQEVVDYFTRTYLGGETPNPCMVCNPRIKFGALLEWAEKVGCRAIATGHYARVLRDESGRSRLFKGADPEKDQSYFLARLDQHQLERAVFPLGGWTKTQVRALAAEHGIAPVAVEESQDVCFVRTGGYAEFIGREPSPPGLIEDMRGVVIGEHRGFTGSRSASGAGSIGRPPVPITWCASTGSATAWWSAPRRTCLHPPAASSPSIGSRPPPAGRCG